MSYFRRLVIPAFAVLAASIFSVCPVFAIDWSKNDGMEVPEGAPPGWVHWWAAQEYFKEGNWQGAIHESGYLLRNPEFSTPAYSQNALVFHGRCYEKMGQPAEAMKAYLKALKRYGANETAFLLLGRLYLKEGNPAAAVKALRGALSMNGDNVDTHLALAEAYLAVGRTSEAEEAIARAAELGGDVQALRRQLAAVGK